MPSGNPEAEYEIKVFTTRKEEKISTNYLHGNEAENFQKQ
jgi:hypothetical protein